MKSSKITSHEKRRKTKMEPRNAKYNLFDTLQPQKPREYFEKITPTIISYNR